MIIVEQGTLIAAKRGAANKFGYIFAHSAIVVICIGGVLDSDMPIRLQEWFAGKVPFNGTGLIANVPAVLLGDRIAERMPVALVHRIAAGIFAVLGVATLMGVGEAFGF
jgi:cytochrome c biogenesis protein ResB